MIRIEYFDEILNKKKFFCRKRIQIEFMIWTVLSTKLWCMNSNNWINSNLFTWLFFIINLWFLPWSIQHIPFYQNHFSFRISKASCFWWQIRYIRIIASWYKPINWICIKFTTKKTNNCNHNRNEYLIAMMISFSFSCTKKRKNTDKTDGAKNNDK